MVERLVTTLEETGQLANTFILFTSDNGFRLGQHRIYKGKRTAYDEDVRVPLLVRGPGVMIGTTDALAMNVDLAVTVLVVSGAGRAEYTDGRTLTRAFRGARMEQRVALLQHLATMDPADPKYVPAYRALRTRRYLYVEYLTKACVVEALSARLAVMATCAGVACRTAEEATLPVCAR